jgi:F-type H+-transporting ATPase subunit epsilon
MPDKKLHLQILSPGRTVLDDSVDMVILKTVTGDKGVLAGHERCAMSLASGLMRIRRGSEWSEPYMVNGGFATVENDAVVVMSVITERISRMESLMAELEQQRLKKKTESEKYEQELKRTETALRRVLVENDVGAYTVLRGKGDGDGIDGANE